MAQSSLTLTVLIADVRGYTAFTNEYGSVAGARLADRFAVLCRDVVYSYDGELLELRGDEALSIFRSPRSALVAAIALQERFREEMVADPSLPLRVGMGIDVGELVPVQGGYRGGALNLAARLCSLAGGGDVFCSPDVVAAAGRIDGVAYVERGKVQLKGLPDPVRVIHVLREEDLPDNFPPLVSLVARPSNLPPQATPFIGRAREVEEVAGLLVRDDVRLLTLVGVGGTGKTRLAVQVGGMVLDAFERGVYMISFASLTDPALVASTIAGALKVKESAGQDALQSLVEYLRDRTMLLILDNFEHLLPARDVVAALLKECSPLKVLVTSRVALHLTAEHEYPVPPLSLPVPEYLEDPQSLMRVDAVALFVERARAVKPDFQLTGENAGAVSGICTRLDGLPLAIELAAARIKLFPPHALVRRLQNRLGLLTGGSTDLPDRLQTLRGAIDWSYALLSDKEQTLFARLAVFANGCTLDAADDICNPDRGLDLLDCVGSLVDKSLIRQVGEDEPRFAMLETIREYAAEKLDDRGEVEAIRQAHARYFFRLAGTAEINLRGAEQRTWLTYLDADLDNLRTALRWFLASGDATSALRLASALFRYWYGRGYWAEGRRWLEEGLEERDSDAPEVRARALSVVGHLSGLQGQHESARATLEEARGIYVVLGDHMGMARVLTGLGALARQEGQYDEAAADFEESLRLYRTLGDSGESAITLLRLATLAGEQGNLTVAEDRFRQALDMMRAAGDLEGIAGTLRRLARVALHSDRVAEAESMSDESLRLAREIGAKREMAYACENLARIALRKGDVQCAHDRLRDSLLLAGQLGESPLILDLLAEVAQLSLRLGQAERTACLKGAETALRDSLQIAAFPMDQADSHDVLSRVRTRLDQTTYTFAWQRGQAMDLAAAVEYALQRSDSDRVVGRGRADVPPTEG